MRSPQAPTQTRDLTSMRLPPRRLPCRRSHRPEQRPNHNKICRSPTSWIEPAPASNSRSNRQFCWFWAGERSIDAVPTCRRGTGEVRSWGPGKTGSRGRAVRPHRVPSRGCHDLPSYDPAYGPSSGMARRPQTASARRMARAASSASEATTSITPTPVPTNEQMPRAWRRSPAR